MFICEILANITQLSDVAPGPLVFSQFEQLAPAPVPNSDANDIIFFSPLKTLIVIFSNAYQMCIVE
jgi:hypothetical protein